MISAVIFDMDGVIIDSQMTHYELYASKLKMLDINVDISDLYEYAGITLEETWDMLLKKYNLSLDIHRLVQEHKKRYLDYVEKTKDIRLVDGVTAFLQRLRDNGLKTAVASSAPVEFIEKVFGFLNLDQYFDIKVSGDFVERSKPEPDIFIFAADKLNKKHNECIVVEDASNGVEAAAKAGMRCIGYKNPHSGSQDLSRADIVTDDFSNIDLERIKTM